MKISKRAKKLVSIFILGGAISLLHFLFPSLDMKTGQSNVPKESFDFSQKTLVHVSRVVDGDTIKVVIPDQKEEITVRLIGINTPESVDPRRPVQCFGKEAGNRLASLIADKDVYVESDPTQSQQDKYGRSLAYVFDIQGVLINKKMVEDGYAFEYTYHVPYIYQEEFKKAEKQAKVSALGLWDKDVCEY